MFIEIQEDIQKFYTMGLLDRLLGDKTTTTHIFWATDTNRYNGERYAFNAGINPSAVAGVGAGMKIIKNRIHKESEQQEKRTREMAEVHTPRWLCQRMNDALDAAWFGRPEVFFKGDTPTDAVAFAPGQSWQKYVDLRQLEITCGEAPFLVSRYDATTGEAIPIPRRIGLLDRKLRVVGEQAKDEEDWLKWAMRAFESVYGYEYQGDSLLIARVNLLKTFEEYLKARWHREPTITEYRRVATTIAWNLWQMDGLTGRIPHRRSAVEQLDFKDFLEIPSDAQGGERQPFCRIRYSRRHKPIAFHTMDGSGKRRNKMKFDYIVGNPPFQDESKGDNETYKPPIYHQFLEGAYAIGDVVAMIHPARFLFNAGKTPKAWNEAMLQDPHLKVLFYEPNSSAVFPNTEIKGGVAITYRDKRVDFGPIGVFTPYDALNTILKKVTTAPDFTALSSVVITRTAYRLTDKMHAAHPEAIHQLSKGHAYDMSTNIFERLPQIFKATKPEDGGAYIRILGREENTRCYKYIRRDYVKPVVNLDKYKVFLPKANGNGRLGEVLSSPILSEPGVGATETFLSVGVFETQDEGMAGLKYIKTKLVRALLGALKVTQDLTPGKWAYVPLQDFTPQSDIDWSANVADIDRQLYCKYGLSASEVDFIESHVKEMV